MNKLTPAQNRRFKKEFENKLNYFGYIETTVKTIKQHLADELAQQKKEILDKLSKEGHGSGNWRRLISMMRS